MTAPLIAALPLWIAETNAWVIAPQGPGGECVVIDVPPETGPLNAWLAERDLRCVAVLATHGHLDHVAGVGGFLRETAPEAPFHLHNDDLDQVRNPERYGGQLIKWLQANRYDFAPPEEILGLDDGQSIFYAGLRLTAVHTPGHTPGSVCFTLSIDGQPPMLFSGDQLFAGSIGRTDLPGGDFDALMASMKDKVLPLADETVVLPGHGRTTTIGQERATNPYLQGI